MYSAALDGLVYKYQLNQVDWYSFDELYTVLYW